MADIRLVRPEAGTNQAVACAPDAKFVFDFPTDAATLSRNGDNLVMTFEDGASLTLTDFYKAYSSKNMPSFEVDGAQVAGADFFAAMNEPDLMPAAGPGGRGAAGVGGARYHEYANMALYDGLDRLGGLDVGWPDGGYEPEIDGAAGRVGDEVAELGSMLPSTPPRITVPVQDEPEPDKSNPDTPPDNPNRPIPNTYDSSMVVDEEAKYLDKHPEQASLKNDWHTSHNFKGDNSFTVDLNGEGGTIVVSDPNHPDCNYTITVKDGEATVQDNTEDQKGLVTNGVRVTVESAEYNEDTNEWTVNYHYELEDPGKHDKTKNDDVLPDNDGLSITVTDEDGETARSKLTAEVHDGVPGMAVESDNATASVTVDMGADADGVYGGTGDAKVEVFAQDAEGNPAGEAFTWTNKANPGQTETDLTKMQNGEVWTSTNGVTVHKYGDRYEFTNNEEKGQNLTVKATDADGDTVQKDVHLNEAQTNITVGTKDKDTLTPGEPDDPDDTPTFESSNDTGANDFVIGDIYAQENAGNVGNFAFLVDTSQSLYDNTNANPNHHLEEMIGGLKSAIQLIIDALKKTGGSADILVAEFNMFARHVHEFHLAGDSTLENIDGNGHSLQDFLNEFHIGGYHWVSESEYSKDPEKYAGVAEEKNNKYFVTEDKVSDNYNDKFGYGSRVGTTNYDNAMDVAKQWFESKGVQDANNQTFFITDGVPTVHVEDRQLDSNKTVTAAANETLTVTGHDLLDALQSCDWEFGEPAEFECNGKTIYVDEAGVLYFDQAHTQLVVVQDGDTYYPLIVQKSENDQYEVHQVTGKLLESNMEGEIDPSQNALDELSEVSDVVILGVGTSFKKEVNTDHKNNKMTGEQVLGQLTGAHENVTTHTGLEFDGIADAIQESLKDLDPESDFLMGGKGNDILFGDRVDYDKKEDYAPKKNTVEDVTQNALFAMAAEVANDLEIEDWSDGNAEGKTLSDLAGFIREHAKEFDEKLDDMDNDKGGSDVLIGGTGHDVLYGQGGSDILIGDGGDGYLNYLTENENGLSKLREELSQTNAEPTEFLKTLDSYENADTAHGDDLLFGGTGDDILLGGAGNDKLFGGKDEDILYGGSGNDYLDGGEDKDTLYGGAGDDLIVYDSDDYAIFGGDGIDILLSDNTNDTLKSLTGGDKPKVDGVEVFLKSNNVETSRGFAVEDLTSLSDLAKKAGITVEGDRLTLSNSWEQVGDSNTYTNKELGLTVEIQGMEQVNGSSSEEVEQLVFQLQTTNS